MLVADIEVRRDRQIEHLAYALDPAEIRQFVSECWADPEVLGINIWQQKDFHSERGRLWYTGFRVGDMVKETSYFPIDWEAIDARPNPRPQV